MAKKDDKSKKADAAITESLKKAADEIRADKKAAADEIKADKKAAADLITKNAADAEREAKEKLVQVIRNQHLVDAIFNLDLDLAEELSNIIELFNNDSGIRLIIQPVINPETREIGQNYSLHNRSNGYQILRNEWISAEELSEIVKAIKSGNLTELMKEGRIIRSGEIQALLLKQVAKFKKK